MRKNDGWTIKYRRLARVYGRQEHEQWIAEKSKNKTKQIRLLEEQKAKLKEQLHEANEALKCIRYQVKTGEFPCDACGYSMKCDGCWCGDLAKEYLEKWGVK